MGVYRFEDLRVWQAAREQSNRVGTLMTRPAFQRDRDLTDQMNRAALSVLFNISGYYAAHGRRYLSEQELSDLIALNESIARMLRRWQATIS